METTLDTGDYDLTVRLWDAPSAGSNVWVEAHSKVPVVRGYFSLVLGGINAQLSQALAYTNLHIDVTCTNPVAASGRQRLLSVPYALNGVPPGSIISFGGQTNRVPHGWLLCDGHEEQVSDYPALFYAIEHSWGGSNDVFRVPDLRGQFLRGVDLDADVDPDADARTNRVTTALQKGAGGYQGDEFQTHIHYLESWYGQDGDGSVNPNNAGYGAAGPYSPGVPTKTYNAAARHGPETRPKNAAVNYIIKY